ncbi:hypothetical protein GCM10009117_25720 [Gangjinia marincola]|uniref:Uncharacterized protein n=1 Tax=Gangjinia marincola TaxID=578463 RepID=A0ABN1MJK9_9FLAO
MIKIEYLRNQLIEQLTKLVNQYWSEVNIDSSDGATSLNVEFDDGEEDYIKFHASFSPLDIPWRLSSKIKLNEQYLGDLEEISYDTITEESKYELYPFLLNDEEKIRKFVILIRDDLKNTFDEQGLNQSRKSRFLLD